MTPRINVQELSKGFMESMLKPGAYIRKAGFDSLLLELINMRVSQINGCAFCLDMHYKDAIHLGEDPQRLYSLPAWRECPYYSDAERAVLAYAEAVTANEVTDEVFDAMTDHFDQQQIADLTLAIVTINGWNRINRAFHTVPGFYQVGMFA